MRETEGTVTIAMERSSHQSTQYYFVISVSSPEPVLVYPLLPHPGELERWARMTCAP